MTNKLCIEKGCSTAQHSRKLCNKHYQMHKYRGTLDSISPNTKHSLTNVDLTTMTGDCSICGSASKVIRVSPKHKQIRCETKVKQHRNRKLLYAGGQQIPTHEIHEAFNRMYSDQNGLCAICGKVNLNGSQLSVDHCHETGEIRGLLCHRCNTGIGLLGDKVETLQAALTYLTNA